MNAKNWLEYEQAVNEFIKALHPVGSSNYTVKKFDLHSSLEVDKNTLIETRVGLFPIKILIRCLHYKDKLTVSHIDKFHQALKSSSATSGIIFSYSGFKKAAIKKCNTLGITWCNLYENQPPLLPSVINYTSVYLLNPRISLQLGSIESESQFNMASDILSYELLKDERKVYNDITKLYNRCEQLSLRNKYKNEFPKNTYEHLTYFSEFGDTLELIVGCEWLIRKTFLKGYLENGYYTFSNDILSDSKSLQAIDESSTQEVKDLETLSDTELTEEHVQIIICDGSAEDDISRLAEKLL
ncbi:restriction endonuclease [Wukongibacter baidiensis]|uniref:restriction endonuclease n=1 Tax=Wukongibacter baidiensis TaxID=1723361 RepID=UPI003D7FE37F